MWGIEHSLETTERDHDTDQPIFLEGWDDYLADLHAHIRTSLEQEMDKVREQNNYTQMILLYASLRFYLRAPYLGLHLVTELVYLILAHENTLRHLNEVKNHRD
jgi:hypothetical protein